VKPNTAEQSKNYFNITYIYFTNSNAAQAPASSANAPQTPVTAPVSSVNAAAAANLRKSPQVTLM
jgi:hypothetical protein